MSTTDSHGAQRKIHPGISRTAAINDLIANFEVLLHSIGQCRLLPAQQSDNIVVQVASMKHTATSSKGVKYFTPNLGAIIILCQMSSKTTA